MIHTFIKYSWILLFFFHVSFLQAQMKQIRGSVRDESGKPLLKVQIKTTGKPVLSETNSKGEFVFNFNIPMSGAVPVFIFSKAGYFPYEWEYDRTDNKKIVLPTSKAIDISGTIKSNTNEPLHDATILIKGLKEHWTSDKGTFKVTYKPKSPSDKPSKLKFMAKGYKTAYWNYVEGGSPNIILTKLNDNSELANSSDLNQSSSSNDSDQIEFDSINNDLQAKNEEIDGASTLSNQDLNDLKEYISYLETILETSDVQFSKEALGQDSTIHRELKLKLTQLKDKVEVKELEVKAEKQKNFLLWIAIGLIILILIPTILAFIFYRNNRKTKKLNVVLDQQNTELKKAYQHIHSSVVYAQRIQQSILVKPEGIKQHFEDAFVFFRPKDIVSGDFYWFGQIDNKLIITAVDCTGHGVPGAFMTMMGNSMLNEIVNERRITEPAKILSELHKKIHTALLASGNTSSNDGMDIALTCVDSKTKEVQFAGANNPLYFISNKEFKTIKGERSGLGGTKNDKELKFENHEIDISEIDRFYLVSDGFQDQFGGKENRKYMKKRFKNLLLDISEKPFDQQEQILDKELTDWKGKNDQTDDVLVIGIKL